MPDIKKDWITKVEALQQLESCAENTNCGSENGGDREDERSRDRIDALRWRALIGCERVRVLGWAGLADPQSNYAHIGLELWTRHEYRDENERNLATLTAFVDKARGAPYRMPTESPARGTSSSGTPGATPAEPCTPGGALEMSHASHWREEAEKAHQRLRRARQIPDELRLAMERLDRTDARHWKGDRTSYVAGNVNTADVAVVLAFARDWLKTRNTNCGGFTALDKIAVYDFDGPYCPGWKGAARQMQEWACEALGIAKPWDHPNFSMVALELSETLPTATDPPPARGGGQCIVGKPCGECGLENVIACSQRDCPAISPQPGGGAPT